MPTAPESMLSKTRQGWKLLLGSAAILASATLLWWGIRTENMLFVFSGFAVFFLVAPALPLSIRCPQCGARWLWIAISKHDIRTWATWLLSQEACPKCGHDPEHPPKPAEAIKQSVDSVR